MKQIYLFDFNKANRISRPFSGPVYLSAFGLPGLEYEVNEKGDFVSEVEESFIYFEKLLYDDVYDVNCTGIQEDGIIASEPLTDDCGCLITLDYCRTSLYLSEPGIFQAVYSGPGREDTALIFYQEG